jgi:hypothetical protein
MVRARLPGVSPPKKRRRPSMTGSSDSSSSSHGLCASIGIGCILSGSKPSMKKDMAGSSRRMSRRPPRVTFASFALPCVRWADDGTGTTQWGMLTGEHLWARSVSVALSFNLRYTQVSLSIILNQVLHGQYDIRSIVGTCTFITEK